MQFVFKKMNLNLGGASSKLLSSELLCSERRYYNWQWQVWKLHMDWIKLTERREAGHRQIIMGSEYIKNQLSNTPATRKLGFLCQYSDTQFTKMWLGGWWFVVCWWPPWSVLKLFELLFETSRSYNIGLVKVFIFVLQKKLRKEEIGKVNRTVFQLGYICQSNSSLIQTVAM